MTENIFVRRLEKLFLSENYYTRRELGVGYGIADLVLIKKNKINKKNYLTRSDYHQFTNLLKEEYFAVLDIIPDQSNNKLISFDSLLKHTHLSLPYLKYNILKFLEKGGYIKVIDKKFYCKVNGWVPLAKEVIAIEAKLKNWKGGMRQAIRYKSFADKSYLAVPKDIHRLVDLDLLKKYNIGLIVFDTELNIKKIILPVKMEEPQNDNKRNYAIEYFWNKKIMKQFDLV